MEIKTIEKDPTTSVVVLSGKLDILGAEVIALPLANLSEQKRNLMVDMSGVNFVASIGLRHLVSTAKALSQRNCRLVILSPSDMVREVLTTSGLLGILPVAGTESEALVIIGS